MTSRSDTFAAGLFAPRSKRRWIAYNPKTGMYLKHDCLGETSDRTWAWSGTTEQKRNMREVYPLASSFKFYLDGEEKNL